jgi:hypothetical protein
VLVRGETPISQEAIVMSAVKLAGASAAIWLSLSTGAEAGVSRNVAVQGGGTLSTIEADTIVRCPGGRQSDDLTTFTSFSYSLDTVTNPTVIATLDEADHACEPTRAVTLKLQGGCNIVFDPERSDAVLNCPGTTGYVDPKYVIVGVTYVPPGPDSFVQYSASQSFGTTTSTSSSFASGVSWSVSVGAGFNPIGGWLGGKATGTQSSSSTQTSTASSSITIGLESVYTDKVMGPQNAFSPVDHDYDLIWLWLNPVQVYTVFSNLPGTPPSVAWNGYGFDMSDQPAMDIWPIEVGYLNGHFGPLPPQDALALGRSWAANQQWAPGDGPALTSTDFANILRADPFTDSNYQVVLSSSASPATTTDGRFTIAAGTSAQSFAYRQPAPGSQPATEAFSSQYSSASSLGTTSSYQTEGSWGVDVSISASWLVSFSADLKKSWTSTQTHQSSSLTTNTTTQVGSVSITGPSCGSSTPPCSPVYTGPSEFDVYQDNVFGTFMFNPVR